jgi:hypothetical protein
MKWKKNNLISLYLYINIVKPVLRGHIWDKEKGVL